MKKNILIAIALITMLGIGLIIGIKLPTQKITTEENKQQNENNNSQQTEEDNNLQPTEKYQQEDLERIIDEQLDAIVNKQNLEQLTNQERLRLLLDLYQKENIIDINHSKIDIKELRKIHQNSIIKNLNIEYSDIYDSGNIFSSDEQGNREIAYEYNEQTAIYTYTGASAHGALMTASTIYKELIEFKEENNVYTIKYRYVFGNNSGDGPTPWTLYYSGIDAYNRTNAFKKFEYTDCVGEDCTDYSTPAMTYIKENYNNIKPNLPTYTYTFKAENEQLFITSFSVE